MGLALVSEDIVDDARDTINVSAPGAKPRPAMTFKFPTDEVIAALTAIAGILGVRLAMFLSLAGAFAVALTVLRNPSVGALVGMGLFNVTVLGPVMALCAFRRI